MNSLLNFDPERWDRQVLASSTPVLVDLQAPWVGPFLAARESLEELADQLGGEFRVGVMDLSRVLPVDQAFRFAESPVLALFRSGRLILCFSGHDRVKKMRTWLSQAKFWSPQYFNTLQAGA